jgi:AAA domain
MKVINLFGGPGAGKSTTAAGLFYAMKKEQLNVELVTEYAKDAVWERRHNLFDDQIYIFAKQQRRIARLKGHGIDWVITDSPIPLGIIYTNLADYGPSFPNLVMEVFNQYENFNFLLNRNFVYNPVGRNQKDEGEAKLFDQKVTNLLDAWQVPFNVITAGETAVDIIMKDVVHKLINKQLTLDL